MQPLLSRLEHGTSRSGTLLVAGQTALSPSPVVQPEKAGRSRTVKLAKNQSLAKFYLRPIGCRLAIKLRDAPWQEAEGNIFCQEARMPMLHVSRAFTLSEMLSTLAITAVLLGVALPGAQNLVHNQQLISASNTLIASLALARSEAIKRRLPVLVDNIDGSWESGWRVFADVNSNGQYEDGEPQLLQAAAFASGVIAKGNTPVRRYIRYTPSGGSKLIGGGFQAGTLTLCHATGTQAVRRLVLSASGRVRRAKDEPAPC